MPDIPQTCPHCNRAFSRWRVPEGASWDEPVFLVCFNDDCPYFVDGWTWMKEQYNQGVSYRYMINPTNGASSPFPVWSRDAMRELIIPDGEGDDQ